MSAMNEEEFLSLAVQPVNVTVKKRSSTPAPQPRKRVKRSEVHLPSSLDHALFCRTQKPHRYCNGCSKIPLGPYMTTCDCKAIYCEACARKVTRCPRHSDQEIIFIPDKSLRSKISKLKLKLCPNHQRGCPWEGGEVYRLRQHLSECAYYKKKARSKKESKEASLATPTNAMANTNGNTSSDSEVIVIPFEQHEETTTTTTNTTISTTTTQQSQVPQISTLPPILPIEPTCTTSLQGYESMPDTPSTVNQPETGQGPAPRDTVKSRDNSSQLATQAMMSTNASISPPRNFDMTRVSTYHGLGILHWTSPTFSSCQQLGYRLNLVIRCNPDDYFALDIAVKSAQDSQNHHLKFPCTGMAKVKILNPHSNSNHVKCSVKFKLQFPSNEAPDFAEGSCVTVKFPENFVDNDCLYLQVLEVRMDGSGRPWLMNPYLTSDSES